MKKKTVAINIKNTTYKINLFHAEVIALIQFKSSFLNADKELHSKVKAYIRELLRNKDEISAQIIEDAIFFDTLSKKTQKELKNLTYL